MNLFLPSSAEWSTADQLHNKSSILLVTYINRKIDRLIDWMESLAKP